MAKDPLKQSVLQDAGKHPEKFYPIKTLKEKGFARYTCSNCNRFFWSVKQADVCGDSMCVGGFHFIGKSPAKKQLDYIETWKEFAKIHSKLGYTPIKRYPVVARWNPTVDFTIADIAAFQPYVVTGEIKPPANPLVIPQFCLRFNDIDNVGITGHHVGFVMMGEKEFVPPDVYDVDRYLSDHLTWLTQGMGVPIDELKLHEDVWAGGGNLGPSIEFFSAGLELSNQVYMQYDTTSGKLKELKIKVLDMGQGQERVPWFTGGKASIYESVFPPVLKKLRSISGVKYDDDFMKKFSPIAAQLNVDETPDIEKAWTSVAKQLGMNTNELREKVVPNAALYSVAEHTRALLFAINDGALPSNVGGMYNLRVILRRALGFIDRFDWELNLPDIAKWHADYLQPLYPELQENLDSVSEILDVEKKKFEATKKKTEQLLPRLMERELSTGDLLELYDSNGIAPELIRDEAVKQGKQVKVPGDFYALLAGRHMQKEQSAATERAIKVDIPDSVPPTTALYFNDYTLTEFDALVVFVKDACVVLDHTVFYPVSGGQVADKGKLNDAEVVDVFKQGPYIIHVCPNNKFKVGDKVHGDVDRERRIQLAQHHTSTHIVNAAAKKILGKHIFQAGAKKELDKAHIDLTHYDSVSDEQLQKIENEANRIIKENIDIELKFMPREEAEAKYSMAIYQGGAVPGKQLRIVNIKDVDVEACGGTHLTNTSQAQRIKLLKSSKIKDGVIRLIFAAGKAADSFDNKENKLVYEAAGLLKVEPNQLPARVEELFNRWKLARRKDNILSVLNQLKHEEEQFETVGNHKQLEATRKKIQDYEQKLELLNTPLQSEERFDGDVLTKTAEILRTQPENIAKTIKRFLDDIEVWKNG